MGSERSLWKTFKRNMSQYGEFDRHEDLLNKGVPDVSYKLYGLAGGWIELKHAHKYPVRETTIFKIEHFTPEQKAWLRRRGSAGDNCWVLLQVERDYWLFDWQGAQSINKFPWAKTASLAIKGWQGRVDWEEMRDLLACS